MGGRNVTSLVALGTTALLGSTAALGVSGSAWGAGAPGISANSARAQGPAFGVTLRVVNNTAEDFFRITDHRANQQQTMVPRGGHHSVTGRSNAPGGKDVRIALRVGPTQAQVWGYNPDIGWPSVGVSDKWFRYGVGETHTIKAGSYQFKVTRKADHNTRKFFTVRVTD